MIYSDVIVSYNYEGKLVADKFLGTDIKAVVSFLQASQAAMPNYFSKRTTKLPYTFFADSQTEFTLIGKKKIVVMDHAKSKAMRLGLRKCIQGVACLKMNTPSSRSIKELENIQRIRDLAIPGCVQTYLVAEYPSKKSPTFKRLLIIQELGFDGDFSCYIANMFDRYKIPEERHLYPFLRDAIVPIVAMHEKNYVYRDVKLDNYVRQGHRLKLIDFTSMCPIGTSTAFGSDMYTPPEAVQNLLAGIDRKTANSQMNVPNRDIWAFGILIWVSLFKKFPSFSSKINNLCTQTTPVTSHAYEILCDSIELECRGFLKNLRKEFLTKNQTVAPENLHELTYLLLQSDPQTRPTGQFVLETLQRFLVS